MTSSNRCNRIDFTSNVGEKDDPFQRFINTKMFRLPLMLGRVKISILNSVKSSSRRQPDHYKSLWMITTNLGGERLLCGRGGWVGQPLHQGGRRQLLGQDKCKTVRRRRRRRRRICSGCKWLFTCLISGAKAASKEGKTDVYSVKFPNYFKSKSDMCLLQF